MPKTKKCKDAIRKVRSCRAGCEKSTYMKCPYCLLPCISCIVISIKSTLVSYLIEPFLMIIVSITAIISCLTRICNCKHGKDCLFSSVECIELCDEAFGLYWEVRWWRKYERKEGEEDEELDKPMDV